MLQLQATTAWIQDCVLLVDSQPGSSRLKKPSSEKQCSSFSHVIPGGFNESLKLILVFSTGRTQISNPMPCPELILYHSLKWAPDSSISHTWSSVSHCTAISHLLFPAFGKVLCIFFLQIFFLSVSFISLATVASARNIFYGWVLGQMFFFFNSITYIGIFFFTLKIDGLEKNR